MTRTHAIVPEINGLLRKGGLGMPVVYTRDWHPAKTEHFAKWPVHCVAGTKGAEFLTNLHVDGKIVSKGQSTKDDGYSAFDGTGLEEYLRGLGVVRVLVCGVAAEFCVKATVLDALRLGFSVGVVEAAVASLNEATGAQAFAEMVRAGAEKIDLTPSITVI